MNTKYISFNNLAELEEKLNKLKDLRDEYQENSKSWLISNNVPFFEAEDLSLHIDFNNTSEEIFSQGLLFSKQQELEIKNSYRELGVIYLNVEATELEISYEARRN